MSTILERVNEQKRKTEEKLARGGGGTGGFKWWKPEAGENKIRIMPPWDNEGQYEGQFWREVAQHWNVSESQKGPVLCPSKTPDMEGSCPICEFVDELKKDKSNVEAQKLAKDLRAKTTFLINVVSLKDPVYTAQDAAEYKQNQPDKECPFEVGDPKIQVYACPVTLFDQILGLINSSQEDITDLGTGRDLTLKKIPNKDRFKTRYELYPSFNPSEADVPESVEFPTLNQVGFVMDHDEMVNLLHDGEGGKFLSSGSATKSLPTQNSESVNEAPAEASSEDLEAKMRKELE